MEICYLQFQATEKDVRVRIIESYHEKNGLTFTYSQSSQSQLPYLFMILKNPRVIFISPFEIHVKLEF